jgi:branched-chain amino acid transport system substrate-binding protein
VVVTADHKNSPDIGSSIARQWLDTEGVTAIADVPNSAIALAVNDLVRQHNKVLLGSGVGTSELTGAKCSPNTVQWTYDNWELGHALGRAVIARGGTKWYFLVADYAFGYDLEANTANAVRSGGGTVAGEVRHPLGTADFSSYLLQAQASGANVLALANAGTDTTNAIKQANEFGLAGTMTIVGPIVNINVIQGTGLAAAKGVLAVTPFYWDMTADTRAFAQRFAARHPRHIMPNDMQAGVYAAVIHYLKAVKAVGGAEDGRAVVDAMKRIPTDDPLFGRGSIRADGRKLHPVYLFETKTPEESKGEWDMFKLLATIPAEQAFRPLDEGHCPLVSG